MNVFQVLDTALVHTCLVYSQKFARTMKNEWNTFEKLLETNNYTLNDTDTL